MSNATTSSVSQSQMSFPVQFCSNVAQGAVYSFVGGLLMGWIIKSGPLYTAKVAAVCAAANMAFATIAKNLAPKKYQYAVLSTAASIGNVATIYAYRQMNIIAKTGTIVLSIFAAIGAITTLSTWQQAAKA